MPGACQDSAAATVVACGATSRGGAVRYAGRMLFNRRFFLQGSGLFVAGGLAGCRDSQAPVIAEAQAPASLNTSQRRVIRTLAGMPTTDGAGVRLLRVIGQPTLRNLDPFLMLDRIYSDDPSAYIRGFPDHPHRGFETVSIMLDGKMRHRDSRGNQGVITGGGAQWMTAGRGIIHSEMPEQERGLLSGFQLWVNLPAAEKMCSQFYQDLEPGKLAHASLSSGGAARLISGNLDGLVGPVRARPTDPTLLTLQLENDHPFVLEAPEGNTTFVFVHSGAAQVGPENATQRVTAGTLAILGEGRRLRIQARDERAGLIVASGRPLREPIAQRGPFVMNTEEELNKAWADYRAGVLDKGLVWCPGIPDRSGGCLALLDKAQAIMGSRAHRADHLRDTTCALYDVHRERGDRRGTLFSCLILAPFLEPWG